MKLILVLMIGLLLPAFTVGRKRAEEDPENNEKKHSFLALGDSYTIGESVDHLERWPVQLADRLNEMGFNMGNPRIIATTGWTTSELLQGIEKENITESFDLVSLLIGVNNQYQGLSPEEYRMEYIQLLKTSVRFAGNHRDRVIVLSIPDWGVTPFAKDRDRKKIEGEIDLFNKIKREETEKMGIRFFNITEISRKAAEDASLVADDGLHPSGKMYRLWVHSIVDKVAEFLKGDHQ